MMKIEDIDFILSHFQDQIQLFPRKISTAFIDNKQFTIYNKEQIFKECVKAGFIDCKINGYSEYTEFKGIVRQPPNFIFIDLDMSNFGMDKKKLDIRLNKTLKKIEEYKGSPTVLWSGNGYHIYLPINAIVLDHESVFSKERFPNLFSIMGKYCRRSVSEVFIKYSEIFFTNGNADSQHEPTYKSCLIRIPGSYNSKLLQKGMDAKVRIIQKWDDSKKMPIQLLLRDFRRWITQEEINQKLQNNKRKRFYQTHPSTSTNQKIDWIEKLLQIPIEDHRKYCLRRILVPYLINIKNLSPGESANLLNDWLLKCNVANPLLFDTAAEIKNCLRYVKEFKPLSRAKLQVDNNELYQVLTNRPSITR